MLFSSYLGSDFTYDKTPILSDKQKMSTDKSDNHDKIIEELRALLQFQPHDETHHQNQIGGPSGYIQQMPQQQQGLSLSRKENAKNLTYDVG